MYASAIVAGLVFGTAELITGSGWTALLFYCPMAYLFSKTSDQKVVPISTLGLLGICCEGTRLFMKTGYAYATYQENTYILIASPIHALLFAGLSVSGIALTALLSKKRHKYKEDPPTRPTDLASVVYESTPPSPPSTSPITCPSISAFF